MSRTFILGSESELARQKEGDVVEVEGFTSGSIWCVENERELKACEYLEEASVINPPGQIIAADYGPTPDGLGITVTVWYKTTDPTFLNS